MENKHKISVIILAGGMSSRLGKDKRCIKLNNKSLIDYSLALATKVSDDIVFSSNDYLTNFKNYKVVADEIEGAGPIQGIISSMKQIKYKQTLLLTCDMPFISLKLINGLLKSSEEKLITHYAAPGQFYPFPSLIPFSMHQMMIELKRGGQNSMKDIFLSLSKKEISIPKDTPKNTFLNVNRPEDYNLAKIYIDERPDMQHN